MGELEGKSQRKKGRGEETERKDGGEETDG